MEQQSPSLEDCLKLLKGERDEQRLAGLLLVTKFCKGDDHVSIRKVYDAVGVSFLDRLLKTGIGKGIGNASGGDNSDAYLQLSVTVLAAFCRVPEVASSKDMVSKIPLILEVVSKESGSSVIEECYEFLFLVSTACEDGVKALYESGGMKVLASQMITIPDDSHLLELAVKLIQLIITKVPLEIITNEYPSELSMMVSILAKQFAVLHNALKFDVLNLLSAILSSDHSAPVRKKLITMANDSWSTHIRIGIVAILQNRVVNVLETLKKLLPRGVKAACMRPSLDSTLMGALSSGFPFFTTTLSKWRAPAEKLQALILSESMISMLGEGWLIGRMKLSDMEDPIPADRCILLVLESSRVEVAVLLNELAYMKYEACKSSSSISDTILLKQRDLAIAFSLVEKIIKLISHVDGDEGSIISESTFLKMISGLNETIGVVLEYLQDAKDHGQKKGDDLLASVRITGSYLAETPLACKEKVRELLVYMLSVEGEDEPSPFYSICFLLPMLCQITMEIEGCKLLASSGAYKAVLECLIKLIGPNGRMVEDNGTIFLACDTILNLLLKRDQIRFPLDNSSFVSLLGALAYWTDETDDPSVTMMAASICALIFDLTSEEALLQHPNFDNSILKSLSQLILKSLAVYGQDLMSEDHQSEMDLHHIITSAYSSWADRFPVIKGAIDR